MSQCLNWIKFCSFSCRENPEIKPTIIHKATPEIIHIHGMIKLLPQLMKLGSNYYSHNNTNYSHRFDIMNNSFQLELPLNYFRGSA